MGSLANGALKADIKAAAKLMRYIEEEDSKAIDELKLLYGHTGHSQVIGITGLPGSGKSTLIDLLIDYFRSGKKTVGVIAVDTSSPFTGGSFLGDRIRMQKHSFDEEVFIKSLPTKGWRGGISKVTSRMITVMDAMGKDIILVETAGVGQTEVDIKNLVHTTIVVLVGGLGDYIQIIKAGILEIADIFVINKADKNNTEDLESDLINLFSLDDGGTNIVKEGHGNNKTGQMRIIAFIEDYRVIRKILDYLGIFEFIRDGPPPKRFAVADSFDDYAKNDYIDCDYVDF